MSSVSMSIDRSQRLVAPRGSLWFASLAAMLIDGIKRIDQWQLERRRRGANDVEELLALADRVEATDPGFASDLRGAAIRGARRDES